MYEFNSGEYLIVISTGTKCSGEISNYSK